MAHTLTPWYRYVKYSYTILYRNMPHTSCSKNIYVICPFFIFCISNWLRWIASTVTLEFVAVPVNQEIANILPAQTLKMRKHLLNFSWQSRCRTPKQIKKISIYLLRLPTHFVKLCKKQRHTNLCSDYSYNFKYIVNYYQCIIVLYMTCTKVHSKVCVYTLTRSSYCVESHAAPNADKILHKLMHQIKDWADLSHVCSLTMRDEK